MKIRDLLTIKGNGGSVIEALCNLEMQISGEEYTNLEANAVFEGAISYDSDLEELLLDELNITNMIYVYKDDKTYLHTSVKGLDKDSSYIFMSDGKTNILVPIKDEPNRHDEELSDETFLFFEEIIEISDEVMDSCDICKKSTPRDILINISPGNEIGDLKEKYDDFDGMVCPNCYSRELCK